MPQPSSNRGAIRRTASKHASTVDFSHMLLMPIRVTKPNNKFHKKKMGKPINTNIFDQET